ncbi:hypothetical protein [Streptomyces sp. NPDC060366]|uniref:hypothetical protein n=1 Tax=Streptomyces sp. NPDC060366 TaxID=3347105 RepID=UPI00365185C9
MQSGVDRAALPLRVSGPIPDLRRYFNAHEDDQPRRTNPELPRRPFRPESANLALHDAGFTAEEKYCGFTRPRAGSVAR